MTAILFSRTFLDTITNPINPPSSSSNSVAHTRQLWRATMTAIQAANNGASSSSSAGGTPPSESGAKSYPPPTASLAFPDDPFAEPERKSAAQIVDQSQPESLSNWAKATRFTVLNHFSHVTSVARNGAHNLLSSPLFQQRLQDDNQNRRTSAAASVGTTLLQHGPVGPFGPNNPDWKHSEVAKKSGTTDFDSAHVYLARWAKIVAEEGEANRRKEAESRRAMHRAALDVEDSEVGSFEVWDRLPHIDRVESTRTRDNPLSAEAWKSLFDEQGHPRISRAEMKALIFQQGFGKGKGRMTGTHWDQMDSRAEAWSFLLDAQPWNHSIGRDERRRLWNTKAEEYWTIKTRCVERMHPTVVNTDPNLEEQATGLPRPQAEGEEEEDSEWEKAIPGQPRRHTLAFWREQRHRIHVDCLRVDRKLPFFRDEDGSIVIVGGGQAGDEDRLPTANAHAQRLEEILLAYVAWDISRFVEQHVGTGDQIPPLDLLGGYVQGMSDLCAPLYVVCHGDEAKTFWLLVGLMNRSRKNFYSDQSGMKMQLSCLQKLISVMDTGLRAHLESIDGLNLFFCFRWLLVCFKREFEFPDILMLWEAIWAAEVDRDNDQDPESPTTTSQSTQHTSLSNHFQIFVALAILEQQRDVVIKYLQHFDEILQYMNGLSGQIDVDTTIAEAQVFCLSLRALIGQQQSSAGQDQNNPRNVDLTASKSLAETVAIQAAIPRIDEDLRSLVAFHRTP